MEIVESLVGKRVLISGGTTGIGRAAVDLFVKEGAQVATFARTAQDLAKLREEQPGVFAFEADQSDKAAMQGAFDQTASKFGGIDILVINAGVAGESVTEMSYPDWKSVIDINLVGPMLLMQIASEKMTKGAHVVVVGSMSAKTRDPGSDVYVASKSGIRGFVDSAGRSLGDKGILVSLIEPGLAESDMTTDDKTPEQVAKMKAEDKMMDAVDVARSILFVAAQPEHMVIPELQIRPRAQLI